LAQLRFHVAQTHDELHVQGYSSRGSERMFDGTRPQRQAASDSLEILRERAAATQGRAASTSPHAMRPSRSSLGSTPVQSTTVDGLPAHGPPSRTTATASPNTSATIAAVSGVGSPCRLALVVASGPTMAQR